MVCHKYACGGKKSSLDYCASGTVSLLAAIALLALNGSMVLIVADAAHRPLLVHPIDTPLTEDVMMATSMSASLFPPQMSTHCTVSLNLTYNTVFSVILCIAI